MLREAVLLVSIAAAPRSIRQTFSRKASHWLIAHGPRWPQPGFKAAHVLPLDARLLPPLFTFARPLVRCFFMPSVSLDEDGQLGWASCLPTVVAATLLKQAITSLLSSGLYGAHLLPTLAHHAFSPSLVDSHLFCFDLSFNLGHCVSGVRFT